MKKCIPEGGEYPRWYGVAYDDFTQIPFRVVCYPIPLNLLFGVAWRLKWWFKRGHAWRHSASLYKMREDERSRTVTKCFEELKDLRGSVFALKERCAQIESCFSHRTGDNQ